MSQLKVEFPPEERATTAVNIWLVIVISSLLTIGIFFALLPFGAPIDKGGLFVRELLMGYDKISWERVVFQFATIWMWMLSGATMFLKFLKLRREAKLLLGDWVPQNMNMRDIPALIKVHEQLMSHPKLHGSVALMRMARILSMWINSEDMARTQAYAKQESEMDIYMSDSSYKANRLYIWAMPLLGFVGTVYGVSYGISGFAAFLSGGEVTAEGLMHHVGEITAGLAVAFYCTLLGLLTAGFAAFPSLGAEKMEEEVVSGVDEYVEDRLLARMPSAIEVGTEAQDIAAMRKGIERMSGDKSMDAVVNAIREIKIDFPMEEMARAIESGFKKISGEKTLDAVVSAIREIKIDFPMDQLSRAIDEGFRRLPNPDQYKEVFSGAITGAHDLVLKKYEEFAKSYEHRVGELGSAFASKLEGVAERIATGTAGVAKEVNTGATRAVEAVVSAAGQISTRLDGQAQAVQAAGAQQVQQIAAAHQGYMGAIGTLAEQETRKWEAMAAEFRQLSGQLSAQFQQATAQLNQAAALYAGKVDESSKALAMQMSRVVEIGARIDQLLNATRSMETSFVNLGAGKEFGETLGALRSHLATSDTVMKQLSKPRTIVLQEKSSD